MRALFVLLLSLNVEAMVIDPVDSAFGFAVGPLVEGAYGGRPDLHRMVVLPDGSIAALATVPGDEPGCLAVTLFRFDVAGKVTAQYDSARMGLPRCMNVDPPGFAAGTDGSFYIAGQPSYEDDTSPRVWKVRPDGVRDGSFGASGAAVVPGVVRFHRAHLEVLPDGTVAVGGTARVRRGPSDDYAALVVVHLRGDGTPDPGFGTSGVAIAVPPNRPIYDRDGGGMAHLADGRVLVAGNIFEDDAGAKIYTDATVVRFDASGRLDPGYGDAGFALPLADASTYVQSLAVRNGEAYLAGIQNRDAPSTFVTRLTSSGRLDLAFGDAGVVGTLEFDGSSFDPLVAVDGAGRVYLGLLNRFQRKVLRFTAQGAPDSTFGADGGAYVVPDGWIFAGRGDLAIDRNDTAYFGAGANTSLAGDAPDAILVARLTAAGGHRDGVDTATAVIYYNASLDHFFLTATPAEQALLDSGVTKGWQRTGDSFRVVTTPLAELSPVCRYYGRPEAHLDSHFFSASPDECAAVAARFASSWLLETSDAFRVHAAEPASGACPRGSIPVYRAFDNRADANHYYGVAPRAPAGWIYEGYGVAPLPTAFCAPLV